jgi:hypothetical protein
VTGGGRFWRIYERACAFAAERMSTLAALRWRPRRARRQLSFRKMSVQPDPRRRRLQMSIPRIWLRILGGYVIVLGIGGCGTMLSGTSQHIPLNVSPPGTQITVYRWAGETIAGPATSPGDLDVHRPSYGQPYLIIATKEGHCPQYWSTSTGISPGGWGTVLLFNGIIPLSIDQRTGGLYSIVPSSVAGALQAEPACLDTQPAR